MSPPGRRHRAKIDAKLERRKALARTVMYCAGDLSYLWDENQRSFDAIFEGSTHKRMVLLCSRRTGKSTYMLTKAIAYCIQNPSQQVLLFAGKKNSVKDIYKPLLKKITADAPTGLRPKYIASDECFVFPDIDARILIGGAHGDTLDSNRGKDAGLILVDEAGFIPADKFADTIVGVLNPILLTSRGRMLVASTPAKTKAHPFYAFCCTAEEQGAYVHRTIYDNPRLTPEDIEDEKKESGGESSPHWQREYLAKWITDKDLSIMWELTEPRVSYVFPKEARIANRYFPLLAGDIGHGIDYSAWLGAGIDYRRQKLVVFDEAVGHFATKSEHAREIHRIEQNSGMRDQVHAINRCVDWDQTSINEFGDYGLPMVKAKIKDKVNVLAEVNALIAANQLEVHPRCARLRLHLQNGIFSSKPSARRGDFARIEGYGHFDLISALMYLVRLAKPFWRMCPWDDSAPPLGTYQWQSPYSQSGDTGDWMYDTFHA